MSSEDLTFEDILKHIDKESEHFVIRLETHHRYGREVTIVEPHRPTKDESSLKEIARQLKEALGTGGDVEGGRRGLPKGDWIEAEAMIAGEGEAKIAFSLLKTKYGIQYRLIRFVQWVQTRKDRSVALRIRI